MIYRTLLATCMLSAVSSLAAVELGLVLDDPLTGEDPVGIEIEKVVKGGEFLSDGWQAQGSNNQIRIQLPDTIFPANGSGAMEVDVRNFDPPAQYNSKKHQFINLYSRPDGSKAFWDDDRKSWWNIRGGNNYRNSSTAAGFKWLYTPAGLATRHEHRLIQNTSNWDRAKTYTFRVEWTASHISISLDGQVLRGNGNFGNRVEALQYVFLGKDNVYSGMSTSDGIVYTALRLYAPGGDSGEPPVITEISRTPQGDIVGQTVALSATATDPEGDPITYSWTVISKPDGSDPVIAEGQHPTVTFDAWGDYVFAVTASDGLLTDTATIPVKVVQSASGLVVRP